MQFFRNCNEESETVAISLFYSLLLMQRKIATRGDSGRNCTPSLQVSAALRLDGTGRPQLASASAGLAEPRRMTETAAKKVKTPAMA